MKLPEGVTFGLEYLKNAGTVVRVEGYSGTPHMFAGIDEEVELDRGRLKVTGWSRVINRQTLNKLIHLGYATYTDTDRTRAVFIDKDAIDAEQARLAEIGAAIEYASRQETKVLTLPSNVIAYWVEKYRESLEVADGD